MMRRTHLFLQPSIKAFKGTYNMPQPGNGLRIVLPIQGHCQQQQLSVRRLFVNMPARVGMKMMCQYDQPTRKRSTWQRCQMQNTEDS